MTAGGWNPVKALWIGLWILFWALGILGADAARAQQGAGAPRPDPAGAYVWTGWDGERFVALDALTLRDELLQEIAQVELGLASERDFDAALARWTEVWKRAAWVTPYAGQWEVLVRLAEARTRALLAAGRVEAAARSVDALLIDLAVSGIEYDVQAYLLATSDRIEAEREHLQDPRLAALRAELARRSGRAVGADAGDPIQAEVARALARGDEALLDMLGRSAVPALVALAEESRDAPLPEQDHDPLIHLVRLDRQRAADFVAANLQGSYLWRRRLLRTMLEGVVLNDDSWNRSGAQARLLYPQWRVALEDFAADPLLVRDALGLIAAYWSRAPLTPNLERVVLDALHAADQELVETTLRIAAKPGEPLRQPVLESLLRDDEPRLRQTAASCLASSPAVSEALLGCAQHPDPFVRRQLARWLADHAKDLGTRPSRELELAALATLLHDAEPDLRASAAKALLQIQPQHMPPIEVYAPLVRDVDPRVREIMTWLHQHPDAAGADALLLELARDPEPRVVEAVDALLSARNLAIERHVALVRARWEHPELPLSRGADYAKLEKTVGPLAESKLGVELLARWYVETEREPSLAEAPQKNSPPARLALLEVLRRSFKTTAAWLLELPPDLLAELALALDRAALGSVTRFEENLLKDLFEALEAQPARHQETARRIDAGAVSLLTKGRAVHVRIAGADEAAPAAVLALLRDARWESTPLEGDLVHAVRAIGRSLPEVAGEAALLEAVRDASCADEATSVMVQYAPRRFDGEALTFAVLERWFGEQIQPMSLAVTRALFASSRFPERVDPDQLVAAARIPAYTRDAVDALAALLEPRYLPVLGECVVADWLSPGTYRDEVSTAAVEAITRYFSDEAAEVLLEVVKRPISDAVRTKCFDALEKIRRYQDERELLAARRVGSHERGTAIVKLVPLLSDADPEVRALAARSLGVLEAVEVLPELIARLDDPDASVQAAARAAIERLTADR